MWAPLPRPMQAPHQTFPVISFLGVVVQLVGALMLIGLFALLRRFVLRRAYFNAWFTAWQLFAVAILALVIRYMFLPGIVGEVDEQSAIVRATYFVYQMAKALGFVFFLRGTLMYVAGARAGMLAMKQLWAVAAVFALASTLLSTRGLNELVIWQSAVAVPALGYCASILLWLPRSRRTAGSVATGAGFALLALLWLAYAGAFGLVVRGITSLLATDARAFVSFNSYFDLTLNILLGYAMIVVLMEDAKREVDDAQAELRITHDQLRRAALYDSLTDSLNRRALAEGVGLEMVRATFGTVVLADVDNLKLVNDHYGHAAGDRLLRRCADVLRATLRPYDKLYRWGGDEFLLIVPSARSSDVLERLHAALVTAEPVDTGAEGEQVRLQVSLGAADYASSEELNFAIERADRAMYQEKSRRKSDPRGGMPDVRITPASIPVAR
jgi:diguanylate cyclase (GGDEF)-like protein